MMIPYGKQEITSDDIESVVKVLKSDFLTQGPAVPKFEKSLCDFTGSSYAVAVNSCTSALHIACLALGLTSKDIVWTSKSKATSKLFELLLQLSRLDSSWCVNSMLNVRVRKEHMKNLPKFKLTFEDNKFNDIKNNE